MKKIRYRRGAVCPYCGGVRTKYNEDCNDWYCYLCDSYFDTGEE